ncbi:MAG: glycerol-3-phosphate acyltransferase [Clostridia bacterium]|nr:glycerol-3-phosphate acyltransferase [Clostridia bacterium]
MQVFDLAQRWWEFAVMAIVCYFIGCFNFAKTISSFKKRDISQMGSGNPGTMNMTREFGAKIGILTFVCDVLKGGLPTLAAFFLYRNFVFAGGVVQVSDVARYFAGFFVIVGHIYPATMRFKGGKGMASTFGVLWVGLSCESAWFILVGLGIVLFCLTYIILSEWGAVGSLIGVTVFAVIQSIVIGAKYTAWGTGVILSLTLIFTLVALTWFAHRANLVRLLS